VPPVDTGRAERRTGWVVGITIAMMLVEIIVGISSGSMALLADGLHMGSHVIALGIALFAYVYARRHAYDPRWSFGTGKVNSLGGYTGALLLAFFAAWMGWESFERAMNPTSIFYREAMIVAVIGLFVNAGSALLLKGDHGHSHGHGSCSHNSDHNLRAAYLHVMADAATSVAAIVALLLASRFDAPWLDPLMGIVGAVIICTWSFGLLRQSAFVLLDHEGPDEMRRSLENVVEAEGARLTDWHCWPIGADRYAAVLSIEDPLNRSSRYFKTLLPPHARLVHLTVEVHSTADPSLHASRI
jgi:cation diffusion facilitator family transporter